MNCAEKLEERRLSLFSRCIAEGIEPSFQYDLEKKHTTRQAVNTYAPYIRSNAHYYSFWPRTIRDLRQWVHMHVFTYFIFFTNFNFTEFLLTLLLLLICVLNILLNLLLPWTCSSVFLAGKFPYIYTLISIYFLFFI